MTGLVAHGLSGSVAFLGREMHRSVECGNGNPRIGLGPGANAPASQCFRRGPARPGRRSITWFRLVSGRAVTGLCAAPFGPTTAPSPSPGGVENSHARRGYSSRTTKGAWLEKGPRTVRSHSQRRPMRLPGAAETAAGRWPGTIPSECRLVRPARTPTTRNRTAATTATLLHLTSVSRAPYATTFATLPPGP
jgi:hypothetical protein